MQKTKIRNANEKNILKKVLILIFFVLSLFIISGLFILYGPYENFRVWLITTSMSTMKHQYIAKIFYSEEIINEILKQNSVIETSNDIDLSLINMVDYSNITYNYKNEYDAQILNKSKENNDYKIIKIDGEKYSRIFSSNI